MRWSWMMVLVATVACKNVPAPDPFDPNVEPEVPNWIDDQLVGQDTACDDAYQWDLAHGTTSFFAGHYAIDGNSVLGNEFWIHFTNPNMEALGYSDCEIVWTVVGEIGDPVNIGSYSMSLTAVIDEEASNCMPNAEGDTFAVGEDLWEETYDVIEAGDTVTLLYTGSQAGTQVGTGQINNGVMSWLSDNSCNYF